jgi:hypothetical protein
MMKSYNNTFFFYTVFKCFVIFSTVTESDDLKNFPNIPLLPEALTASLMFLNSKESSELYD